MGPAHGRTAELSLGSGPRAPGAGLVLVTGASGFIGTAASRELAARGRPVTVAQRHPLDQSELPERLVGEIGPETDWTAALRGVDSVLHLAGIAHAGAGVDPGVLERVNVAGTCNLAEQAAAAGVRRLVFVSSIKAQAERSGAEPVREDDLPQPEDAYGRAKLAAERALAGVRGIEIVVVRPPLVYGPGARGNFAALCRAVAKGWPIPVGRTPNRRSLIALPNLVDALLLCLDHPAAAGRTYLVRDGEDLSTADLVRGIAGALGQPARLLRLPDGWLRAAMAAIGRRGIADRLLGDLRLDDSLIRRELGWEPPVHVARALAESVR